MNKPIYVCKPYLPSKSKFLSYVDSIYDSNTLTNNGPLVKELTEKLKEKLSVKHLLLVNNGTTALMLAYRLKNLAGKKVLTTPYTFAATSTALKWQDAMIKYAKLDQSSWNMSPSDVELHSKKIECEAIVPVNLFGIPCDLERFDKIAELYNLPLIYDSAHSLFASYKGKSIYDFGDIHCISFHATKLFHTVEGGAVIFRDENDYLNAQQLINFGITETGEIFTPGINGKMSEFHAAMGLSVLDDIEFVIEERETLVDLYKDELSGIVTFQSADYEYSSQPIYMPVMLGSLEQVESVERALNAHNIFPRRYFLPKYFNFLNENEAKGLSFSKHLANRVICLPLFNGLKKEEVKKICQIIREQLS